METTVTNMWVHPGENNGRGEISHNKSLWPNLPIVYSPSVPDAIRILDPINCPRSHPIIPASSSHYYYLFRDLFQFQMDSPLTQPPPLSSLIFLPWWQSTSTFIRSTRNGTTKWNASKNASLTLQATSCKLTSVGITISCSLCYKISIELIDKFPMALWSYATQQMRNAIATKNIVWEN